MGEFLQLGNPKKKKKNQVPLTQRLFEEKMCQIYQISKKKLFPSDYTLFNNRFE
jgi:hypothetical protein